MTLMEAKLSSWETGQWVAAGRWDLRRSCKSQKSLWAGEGSQKILGSNRWKVLSCRTRMSVSMAESKGSCKRWMSWKGLLLQIPRIWLRVSRRQRSYLSNWPCSTQWVLKMRPCQKSRARSNRKSTSRISLKARKRVTQACKMNLLEKWLRFKRIV